MTTETMTLAPKCVPPLATGGTVVCFAPGPSLVQEDCDYVRGKAIAVVVNDAHRLAPWAEVLFSADRRWWPFYKGVPSFAGLKYGIGSSLGKKNPFPDLPVRVLKNAGYHGLATAPDALCHGRNSGYAALNLAVHLQPTRILLVGYNLGTGPTGKAHFFGNHPAGLNQQTELYPNFRRSFETLVEPLKKLGIDVVNCSRETSLLAFPCRPLREVL